MKTIQIHKMDAIEKYVTMQNTYCVIEIIFNLYLGFYLGPNVYVFIMQVFIK